MHPGEPAERAGLDDAEHLILEYDLGEDYQVDRGGLAQPGGDLHVVGGQVGDHDRGLVGLGDLADQRLAEPELAGRLEVRAQAVAGEQPQARLAAGVLGQEERAVLPAHQRDQLAHHQVGHHAQVTLALHQAGDPGQVGLQPVLLFVGDGGLPQRPDHRVDVVLEVGDLALGLDRDRAGQVPGGHRAGHLGDRAHLAGEVARQLVDVLRQPLPGAGHALDLGLATETALAAHLLGDPGHLGGERRELVDHRVDRGLQLQDLAAGVHVDLLRQVALGHRRGDLGDVADLAGQVVRHRVDVVGQVLPGARHVRHGGLAAEHALGAHLAGHPGHLAGECAERVDHAVDRLGERRHLARPRR